jgi:hypothetical protein
MPKYTYYCNKCKISYTVVHRLNEIHDVCNSCGNDKCLSKIPVSFNYSKKNEKEATVGSLVKETIEESKRDIEEVKQNLKKRKHEH